MFDYSAERERQAQRFDRHLQRLVEYRKAERSSDCALVFSVRDPAEVGHAAKVASRRRSRSIARTSSASPEHMDDSTAGSERDATQRFAQFAFMKRTFYLDLPQTTLTPVEAEYLLGRPGYFRLRDRRWWFQTYESWIGVVRAWNPVQKEYLNQDTRSAAEELSRLFYDLWRYPVETRVYWQAFAFHRRKPRPWEGTGRLS